MESERGKVWAIFMLVLVLLIFIPTRTTYLFAQNEQFSFKLQKKCSLPELLGKLENTYQIEFAYSYTQFREIEIQAGYWSGQSMESFLFKVLEPHRVLFKKSRQKKYLLKTYDVQQDRAVNWDMYLEGRIFDKENNIPLSQVSVFIEETGIGTLSDDRGIFQLKVPRKYQNALLNFKLFAYKELKLEVAQASLSSAFQMKAEPLSLEPIRIQADQAEPNSLNALEGLPANWEDVASASNLAGPDIVRTLQLLPGISAFDDLNSELKIRGSGGDETLIVLDGIPIYRSDHYFGIFSSISSDYLDKVELYKNILPLEYGGKTGGMLLMEGPANLDEFSAKLDLNLLSASANLQIPLGEENSLVLNGRTTLGNTTQTNFFESLGRDLTINELSNTDFSRLNIIQTDPDFRFYDLNAKLNISLGENSGLHVNFFQNQDKLENKYEANFVSRNNDFLVLNKEVFSEKQNWSNTGASIQLHSILSSKWKLSGNLFTSNYQEESTLTSSLTRVRRFGVRFKEEINIRKNRIFDLGGGLKVKRYFDKNSWEIGLNAVRHQTSVDFSQTQESVLKGEVETSEINAYTNYQIKTDDWLIDIGNRANYYALNNSFYFSPRLQATYKPSAEFKVKGAWGISNQFVRKIVHENQLGRRMNYFIVADEENYPVGKSENYMLGFTYAKEPWTIDVEAFYRNLDGIVEHSLIRPGVDSISSLRLNNEYTLYNGTGISKGIDFFVGFDVESYKSWIAYTLSRTTHQFPNAFNGKDFLAQNDRTHQLKWVNSLQVDKFTFSANYIFSSGRTYLDISDLNRILNRSSLDPESLVKRLPFYQRVDVGLSYEFSLGKHRGSIGLSVFNLTNRPNVDYIQYIYAIPTTRNGTTAPDEVIGTQSSLLDRTMNLSFRLNLR